jgi:uncharacterized membrane protein
MHRVLVLFHLVAVIVWLGGMFFAHVCLRPVATVQLPPALRLPLLAAVLGRFFAVVGVALALLWGSGLLRFAQAGALIPGHWLTMAGLALVMSTLFGLIVFRFHQRLLAAVAAEDWKAGAEAMNAIRVLVQTNLILGFITVAVAVLA